MSAENPSRPRSPTSPIVPLLRTLEKFARDFDPNEVDLQWVIQQFERRAAPRSDKVDAVGEREILELAAKHNGNLYNIFDEILNDPDGKVDSSSVVYLSTMFFILPSHLISIAVRMTLNLPHKILSTKIKPYNQPLIFVLMRLGSSAAESLSEWKHVFRRFKEYSENLDKSATSLKVGGVSGKNLHSTAFKLAEEVCYRFFEFKKTDRKLDLLSSRLRRKPQLATVLYTRRWIEICKATKHLVPSALDTRSALEELLNQDEKQFIVDVNCGYQGINKQLNDLISSVIKATPGFKSELQNLLPILEGLGSFLGVYSQSGEFKNQPSVSEKEFQAHVIKFLRQKLGGEVQEHGHQAGGATDIRFCGVIVELKVERTNGDRDYICKKYTKQATQYQGVEGRTTTVLLVLDLTEKEMPPGDIRNDIHVVDVPTHGGDENAKAFRSKSFVFILNGNTRSPSSYS